MTLTGFEAATTVLLHLAEPAARAVALAACVALGLAAFRVKSTSLHLFTWTAVLYTALAMPFLGWMLPSLAVPAPAFLHFALAPTQMSDQSSPDQRSALLSVVRPTVAVRVNVAHGRAGKRIHDAKTDSASTVVIQRPAETVVAETPAPSRWTSMWTSIQWSEVAIAIYLAVAILFLARFFVGLAFSRRLLRASQAIDDPRITTRIADRANTCGFVPEAAESECISVPVTVGALRSTILLPANWREWEDAKLDAVIAHEVSHVARRDALTQRLSLLHRAIFWFSPLAWWLDRHLAELAEQASDEAALSCGADRNDYARTLLGFFEALQATPGRVWWQGVSMAKAGQAEQRLERILAWRGAVAMGLTKSFAVVVIALAVPVVYLTASVRPTQHHPLDIEHAQDQAQPAPPPTPGQAPEAAPAVSADRAPEAAIAPRAHTYYVTPPTPRTLITGVVPKGTYSLVTPPVAPRAPFALFAPLAPPAWSTQSHTYTSKGRGYSYAYGYDDDERFVIVSGKSDSYTMSGSGEDVHHVERLKKQIAGDFIWFERDEKSYIIRDQATIDRAKKLWAPEEELGKKQEELGARQEELGKQQEELGAKMEQVQVKVPDMTAELDKLKAKLQKLGATATMDQLGDLQSEIGDLQSKMGDIQSQAGDQQSKIGEEMGALGEKQGKLGEEQGKLGEQQGKLAEEAARQMKLILDESIKNGTAQPESQSSGGASL